MISPTPTEQRVVVPSDVPHYTRICIEDLVNTDFDESDVDEQKGNANSRQTNPNLIGWCKRQRGTRETSAGATSSTSWTSESGMRRRRTLTPPASPTPKPTRLPSEDSATSEMEKKKRNKCFELLKHSWKPMLNHVLAPNLA